MKRNKKIRIGVICDNREQYENYIRNNAVLLPEREYIYISEYELPHGIDLYDAVDLRELTRNVRARVSATRLKELTKYGAFDDKSTNTENS